MFLNDGEQSKELTLLLKLLATNCLPMFCLVHLTSCKPDSLVGPGRFLQLNHFCEF